MFPNPYDFDPLRAKPLRYNAVALLVAGEFGGPKPTPSRWEVAATWAAMPEAPHRGLARLIDVAALFADRLIAQRGTQQPQECRDEGRHDP